MGKDFFDASSSVRELFHMASELTGTDMELLLFKSDPEELKKTENTQSAITLMNLSVRRFLTEKGISSAGAAGFSLGEYSALVDAGVLREEDVFPVVLKRGSLMAHAVSSDPALASESGMAAVIGLDAAIIDKLISSVDELYSANYNAPGQTVISGRKSSIEKATELLKEAGARRVIPLKVSGPFHTPLLHEARDRFTEYLKDIPFSDPVKPLFSNVTGARVKTGEEARKLCGEQIVSPVRWTDVEAAILAEGFETTLETGPGKVLAGLWKSGFEKGSCRSTDKVEATAALIEELL
jgi:[acyl-carrier-protein] S-malonyltransferase